MCVCVCVCGNMCVRFEYEDYCPLGCDPVHIWLKFTDVSVVSERREVCLSIHTYIYAIRVVFLPGTQFHIKAIRSNGHACLNITVILFLATWNPVFLFTYKITHIVRPRNNTSMWPTNLTSYTLLCSEAEITKIMRPTAITNVRLVSRAGWEPARSSHWVIGHN
jgi:hypothetical protein